MPASTAWLPRAHVDGDDDDAFDQTNNVAGVARAMRLDGAVDVLARALFSSESRQSSQAVSAKRLRTA